MKETTQDEPKAAVIPHEGPPTWIRPANTPENWRRADKLKDMYKKAQRDFWDVTQLLAKAKKTVEMTKADLVKNIPVTDGTLPQDSPLWKTRLDRIYSQNMIVLGFDWVGVLQFGPESVRPYMDYVEEGIAWAMKMKNVGVNTLVE